MSEKHVLFAFNHAPYGTIFYNEGLRAVVGVTSGIDEHHGRLRFAWKMQAKDGSTRM